MGRFVPGFDTKSGNPISRSGYIVPCKRTSDCYQRCPTHPLTGQRYQCQKRYTLYDVAITGELAVDAEVERAAKESDQIIRDQERTGSGQATEILTNFENSGIPLPRDDFNQQRENLQDSLYDRTEGGYQVGRKSGDGASLVNLTRGNRDAFDPDPDLQAATGEYGICVDMDSAMHQGCEDATMASVVDAVVGCFDRSTFGKWLCGLELSVKDGDPDTASIEGNFLYLPPRVLVEAGRDVDGDGQPSPAIVCTDPIDCQQKCRFLERTSANGAGAPPACAMCKCQPLLLPLCAVAFTDHLVCDTGDLYCSNGVINTAVSTVEALFADVATVVRLVSVCFFKYGLAGCICQMAMTLQPAWRRVSTNRDVRCENGDPFPLLVNRILDLVQQGAETLVNRGLIDPINSVFDRLPWPLNKIGRPIPRVCFRTNWDPDRCSRGSYTAQEAINAANCEDASNGLESLCYYARVNHICTNDNMLNEYTALFSAGYQRVDDVIADFNAAFGESYTSIDPTFAELFRQVELSSVSGPDLRPRRDICSSAAFASSMTLDMVSLRLVS